MPKNNIVSLVNFFLPLEPGLGVGLLTAGRMLGIYMSELWTVVITIK
jgi:hypothetical protein